MDLAMAMGVALFGMFAASTVYFFYKLTADRVRHRLVFAFQRRLSDGYGRPIVKPGSGVSASFPTGSRYRAASPRSARSFASGVTTVSSCDAVRQYFPECGLTAWR